MTKNMHNLDREFFEEEEEEEEVDNLNEEEAAVEGEPAEGEETVEQKKEEEAAPFKTFQTQEELDQFLEAERAKITNSSKTEEQKKEELRIFDADWKPKDWNEFALRLMENPEFIKSIQGRIVPEVTKTVAEKQEERDMAQINKEFDSEYDALAAKNLVPSRTSAEGKKINYAIARIGAMFGKTSITAAYETWKQIPASEGGGLNYVTSKQKLNVQKQKSGLISSPKSGSPTVKASKKYQDLHSKSIDDLVDEQL